MEVELFQEVAVALEEELPLAADEEVHFVVVEI
jgi:hypothetical protein